MASIEGAFLDFKFLDRLALGDTALHRLDPRAKVMVTILFIISVVSYGKYDLTALFPFFIFPVVMISLGNLPVGFIVKKVLFLTPFVLLIGIFNPVFDREVLVQLGPVGISGGWISCASIVVRAMLTLGAAFILVGLTGFPAICGALERMGMPRVLAVQFLFLYRYIFVLTEEGARTSRARELRSFGKKGLGMKAFGSLVGHLLLRTWQRAERIHMAMLARGFAGEFQTRRAFRFGAREYLFLAGCAAVFMVLRFWNLSEILGSVVTGIFQ
jgi:cobalt/nickel transport system permease protein